METISLQNTLILRNGGYENIGHSEMSKYRKLRNEIMDVRSLLVYRGELLTDAYKLLKVEENDFHGACDKIFMIGAKAAYYQRTAKAKGDINRFMYKYSDDITGGMFKQLFELVHDVIAHPEKYSKEVMLGMQLSKIVNKQFHDFFENKSNLHNLHHLIKDTSPLFKIVFRDYLFYFLHTLNAPKYKSSSVLISTSMETTTPKDYAKKRGLIYEYFIPKPYYRYAVSAQLPREFKRILAYLCIPGLTEPVYLEECEQSVRRALLPHFIISVYNTRINQRVLNPSFLGGDSMNLVARRGFKIDQKRFHSILATTGYTSAGALSKGTWYEI